MIDLTLSKMIEQQEHQYFMQRAIELAKKGRYTTRPNPNVGCVIVKDNRVVGEGYHYQAGQPHAEVFALRQAGEHARGATAYVTLEPCSHYGRTPPCADALIHAGIKRVVVAMFDPNPKVAGRGIAKLQDADIDVITGICQSDAYELNKGFFRCMAGELPYVRLKIATSLDGRVAMANGESKWITSEAARDDVQQLRARCGAIITGSQTVLTDQPALTVRSPKLGVPLTDIPQPLLVVLDRRKRITIQDKWYQKQIQERRIRLIQDPTVTLEQTLRSLGDEQVHEVLIEAGSTLSTAFLQAGLVDELIVYMAPCLLGASAKAMTTFDFLHMHEQWQLKLVSHETIGKDLKLTYYIDK